MAAACFPDKLQSLLVGVLQALAAGSEFMEAYRAALDASNAYEASLKIAPPPRPEATGTGTINDLVARYYRSANYKPLAR